MGEEAQIVGITNDENSLVVDHQDNQFEIPLRSVREEGDHLLFLGRFSGLSPASQDSFSVPVMREEAKISKREVTKAKVRIKKTVHERVEKVSTTLRSQSIQVERIPKDEVLKELLEPRVEEGVTIIPVQEEFYVLEKRYRLKARSKFR